MIWLGMTLFLYCTSANDAALHAAQALGIGVIVITPTGAVSGLFHLALLHKVRDRLFYYSTLSETAAVAAAASKT